jgi:DNA-binding beta-propeller fold protein YncE
VAVVGEHLDGTPFRLPQGVHFDPAHGEVYVVDSGNGLVGIFEETGVPRFTFAPGGRHDAPQAVATDAEGNIYVLNARARRVAVFDFRGEPVREIAVGEVEHVEAVPSGIGLGPDGRLYVLDGVGRRILIYGPDGGLAGVVRGSGKGGSRLQAPCDIAFDGAGNLYVTDRMGTPVQVYDASGKYLRGWGKRDIGPADFSAPSGIAVDAEGMVLVADPLRQEVKVFDGSGNFLGRFGGFGGEPGAMAYPTDVAVGRAGRVYVVERVGRRLQVFERISRNGARDRAVAVPEIAPDPGP